jgi:hypothetical protein
MANYLLTLNFCQAILKARRANLPVEPVAAESAMPGPHTLVHWYGRNDHPCHDRRNGLRMDPRQRAPSSATIS